MNELIMEVDNDNVETQIEYTLGTMQVMSVTTEPLDNGKTRLKFLIVGQGVENGNFAKNTMRTQSTEEPQK